MIRQRWSTALLAAAFALLASSRAEAAPVTLTVVQISVQHANVAQANIVLRSFDGSIKQHSVHTGDTVPDDIQVEVPENDTLTIGYESPRGKGDLTLQAGSVVGLHYTGNFESVAAAAGTSAQVPQDPLDFFHVSGRGVYASGTGTAYSFEMTGSQLTVTCTDGGVNLQLLDTNAAAAGGSAFTKRVDNISATGRSTIGYTLGAETTANVTFAQDLAGAQRGDVDAEVNLGMRYYLGYLVPQNYPEALHWLKLAADAGSVDAENDLGIMYQLGHGVVQDDVTAVHYYKLAADRGDSFGQNNLGAMYQGGLGVPQSDELAVHYYTLSAANNNAYAESNLGYMYSHGLVVPLNYTLAARLTMLSAAQGFAGGEVNLGMLYVRGRGVPRNLTAGLFWLRLGAAQGDAWGGPLGFVYEFGLGVPVDYAKALDLYQREANQSDTPTAQAYGEAGLGRLYESGHGVAQDYAAALRYDQFAATHEALDAVAGLGHLYETGHGVPQNYATALHLYQIGAEQHNPLGELGLGRLYENGTGVKQDYATALQWYQEAAYDGLPEAKAAVDRLQPRFGQGSKS
jgi:TPR repeat protein